MSVNVTGTKIRINGTDIGDVLSLGDIKFSRNVKEYSALNSETVTAVAGREQSIDLPLSVVFNPDDSGAQKALHDAVISRDPVKVEIELPNKKTDDGHGTIYTWDAAIVTELTISPEEDGLYKASFTIKCPGFPTETAAS